MTITTKSTVKKPSGGPVQPYRYHMGQCMHTKKQLPSSEMDFGLLCMSVVSGPGLTSAVSSEEVSMVYIILYEQWVTGTMEAQKGHHLQ